MAERAHDCFGTTHFAPARREDGDALRAQVDLAAGHAGAVLDLVPVPVVMLNGCRQVVYANRAFVDLAEAGEPAAVLGRRPGEILGCVHAADAEAGCGTSKFCRYCGAVGAIIEGLEGRSASRHCRILRSSGPWVEAMDLLTTAEPVELGGQRLAVFTIQDVSHEYRLDALERVFYHDVLNRVAAVELMSRMLEQGELDGETAGTMIGAALDEMHDLIQAQSDLSAAEAGALLVDKQAVGAVALLERVRDTWAERGPATERTIALGPASGTAVDTDPDLAARVLGVFVENALEAVGPGGTVTLGAREEEGGTLLTVHNPGVMGRDVRRQIFKRTFSTKSRTRGFGTHAARLFGERYLDGSVSFVSDEEHGTVFSLWLPEWRG